MKRRGFFSFLFPAATAVAIGQKLHIVGDVQPQFAPSPDLDLQTAEVTPYGSWDCECGMTMMAERQGDGKKTIKCLNGQCEKFDVRFLIPGIITEQYETEEQRKKRKLTGDVISQGGVQYGGGSFGGSANFQWDVTGPVKVFNGEKWVDVGVCNK